jgi:DNA repair protein RadD
MKQLRSYQQTALDNIRAAWRAGMRRIVVQLPTGGGKTRLAAEIVNGAHGKKKKVVFEVPSISLIDQTVEMFYDEGITEVGVIQANHYMTDWSKPIQIASVQTLERRQELPDADIVIRDECHKLYKFDLRWMTMEGRWRDVPHIGLSATPWTRGLGTAYQQLIVGATMGSLIEQGWLVPFEVFAPSHPDLEGVRTTAGDYNEKDLGEAIRSSRNKNLAGDIVRTWQEKASDRPTICFAVDRAHAELLKTRFEEAGVASAYMDCNTPLWDRRAIQKSFENGDTKVVCNVEVIGIGVDWPSISCISYCRPTKSEMRFVQNIGRGLRPATGKTNLLVLDHSDTSLRLGFVTDIQHERLYGGKERPDPLPFAKLPKECPQCAYLKPYGKRECPNCGHVSAPLPKIGENTSAELRKFTGKKKFKGDPWTREEKLVFYAELKGYAIERGYKPGWAYMKFRDRLHEKPSRDLEEVPPIRAGTATRQWIKHAAIAWAKSKRRNSTNLVERMREHTELFTSTPREFVAPLVEGTLCSPQDLEDFK